MISLFTKASDRSTDTTCKLRKPWRIICRILVALFVFLAVLALFSAKWYITVYGDLGFDSVLYTLLADLSGVESELAWDYFTSTVLPSVLLTIPILAFFFPPQKTLFLVLRNRKPIQLFPFKRAFATILCVLVCFGILSNAATVVGLDTFLASNIKASRIYENEYVDPNDVQITFPEQKRNLIYIFLESMETTYMDKASGGALYTNVIPELQTMAGLNTNFSHNDRVGGLYSSVGTTWTMGAMVAHTAGIPLKTPPGISRNEYGQDGSFLPGVTSITNILHDNGYYQTLMVGSDASFGGRRQYYTDHGIDKIYDLLTIREEGRVAEDYYVWWGFEDRILFDYARSVLPDIAAQEQPFAFTMLTVDTHHPSGYGCIDCQMLTDNFYENVINCSNRKVLEFIGWCQQQDFYENTTIIVVGDHPTMANEYITANVSSDYDRRVYNCFINAAATPVNAKNREAFTIDMFPTTLAAMGCTIEGDRLGLGTNLFSDKPTLAEEMGKENLDLELGYRSNYYTKNFFHTSD